MPVALDVMNATASGSRAFAASTSAWAAARLPATVGSPVIVGWSP